MTYSSEVARMTWRGQQPAAFKAGLAEFPANYLNDPVAALTTLASVYYSYASYRAKHDLQGSIFRRLPVAFHVAALLVRAMRATDRAVLRAGGLDNLSVNQLDVRQSVLRRVGRRSAADEAAILGLQKFDSAKDKAHTKALLLLGRAELFERGGDWSIVDLYEQVERLLPKIEEEREYRQLARICRHLEEARERFESLPGLKARGEEWRGSFSLSIPELRALRAEALAKAEISEHQDTLIEETEQALARKEQKERNRGEQ